MADAHVNLASRLWRKDAAMWRTPPGDFPAIAARLGWLDSIDWMLADDGARLGELQAWAANLAASGGYDRAILLGMGGACLAPAVFASLFPPPPGRLRLDVIDTTCPDEITRIIGRPVADADLRRCLFIVASKSGASVETIDLYHFFRAQLAARCAEPHSRFVVITDEGTELHRHSVMAGVNKIFLNPHDVGGRYSALSYFGLVPAALLGVDIGELLRRARRFCATTKSDDPAANPALALGMLLGRGALAGRDKLLLRLPGALRPFGLWIEQLVAESTGKDGKGLLPVIVGEDEGEDRLCGGSDDRITVRIDCGERHGEAQPSAPADCALRIDDPYRLGAEFFRWEVATAIAAVFMRINPFDQPDVAQAKDNTRRFIEGRGKPAAPVCRGDDYDLRACIAGAPLAGHSPKSVIAEFHRALKPGNYLGLLAYLPEDPDTLALLRALQRHTSERLRIVTTLGIGPRYLHSTGQLHKGGPPTGRFIQFTAEPHTDLAVPGRGYTFGRLCRAQADGDFAALAGAGEAGATGGAVMRVELKADRLRALAAFIADFTDSPDR